MYKLAMGAATCFFAFILWIIYQADSGGSNLFFDFVRSFQYGDKVGHFCLFGALTVLLVVATKFKSLPISRLNVYLGVILVALFVFIEELSQAYIPTRTFDLVDLTADAVGMLVAAYVASLIQKRLMQNSKRVASTTAR